jgi:hypothetical protein
MSIISADQPPSASTVAAQPLRFWQRFAQTLDEHFAERSKGAVPAMILRRSLRELARCRRLVRRSGETGLSNSPMTGTRG